MRVLLKFFVLNFIIMEVKAHVCSQHISNLQHKKIRRKRKTYKSLSKPNLPRHLFSQLASKPSTYLQISTLGNTKLYQLSNQRESLFQSFPICVLKNKKKTKQTMTQSSSKKTRNDVNVNICPRREKQDNVTLNNMVHVQTATTNAINTTSTVNRKHHVCEC